MSYLFDRLQSRIPEVASASIAVLMVLLVALVYAHERAVVWVTHTAEVKAAISEVFDQVQEAEAGTRGFIITGDEAYLEHYQLALKTIWPSVALLKNLTRDNAEQQQSIARLTPAIERRFMMLSESIRHQRSKPAADVATDVRDRGGLALMKPVRDDIERLIKAENALFVSRIADTQRLRGFVLAVVVVTFLLLIAAFAAWVWHSQREARQRVTANLERESNEAQIRQMQKIEAVGQLTGGLAHDLNNMLAVIISGITLTQKRLAAGDANVQRFVDAALEGANRAATLTTRLMAFSRQSPLSPTTVDANKLILGMTDMMQRTIGETIQHQTVLSAGIWHATADVGQLENVILNLAINARDAMPDGGKLTIETSNCHFDNTYAASNSVPSGDYVLITVTDTGEGMTPDVAAKAFDPFFTTKGVGKGTGLGLSQVFGFMKQSGGHIKIYSEVGHGTTVKLYLPRLYDAGPNAESNTAKVEAWPNLLKDRTGNLILVVEDDDRVREMTVAALRELGYLVIHADGAINALKQLDSHPDTTMLFTDIVMPDVNGRQLAAEALKRRPDIRVLYTTGFTRNAIVHSGKLDAGLHFIAKPFTLVQLDAKMTAVLSGAAAA